MRKPIIAGNWKMHKTVTEAECLVREMRDQLTAVPSVEKVLCPPFIAIDRIAGLLQGTDVSLGAQNMHWEDQGAFTGEVSPLMLKGLCRYVILGHSERRTYFGETDEIVNRKAKAALRHGLIPIICVGETEAQHDAGETEAVVRGQVQAALSGLTADQVAGLVIAYEPVWAIGTGRAATAEQAQAVIGGVVRMTIARLYDQDTAQRVRIQYGGSTNSKNIGEIVSQPDIDGALVGGASLRADEFVAMVRITAQVYGS
ncbi:MAG: triose-phosphate isomerase [Anaerolineae bacterium]|nr:triose-phosphate isomerase [Anaerolineae bacterium]MDW8098589.1 triose-phosphate isomerase [Anaerolineae bacterium]